MSTGLRGNRLRLAAAITVLAAAGVLLPAVVPARQASPPQQELTVERIYGDPPLGGKLSSGRAWNPDGTLLSFMTVGPREAHFTALETATGRERALIPDEKFLELLAQTRAGIAALPEGAESGVVGIKGQATGLGRQTPPSYLWSPRGDAILFVLYPALGEGALIYDLKAQQARPLIGSEQFKTIADVKFSPDGNWVSFVHEHAVKVIPAAGGEAANVAGKGGEEIRRGELDWVYPEELGCRTAYWWSPDSRKIAFLEMDERHVGEYPLANFGALDPLIQPQRYPRPGTNNPKVRVGVVDVTAGKAPGEPLWMDLGKETDIYIPRVTWLLDSKHLAIERLNRAQNQLDLLAADSTSGHSETILREKDPYWVNVAGAPRFLDGGKEFLWLSERDGFRHLYLYGAGGRLIRQLTKGEWEVTELSGVDESAGLAYFVATEKSPLERHLYSVPLAGGAIHRITAQAGMHDVSMAPGAGHYVDTYSNVVTPPRQDVYRADGRPLAVLAENAVPELAEYGLVKPEFGEITGPSGATLYTMMIRPPDFNPARKYPVLVYTYGGPGSQVVRDAWDPVPRRWQAYLWHQMMARKGYIIFELDNRGSPARGHAFETPIFHHLGRVELEDQLAGVAWLKSQPYVDGSRIGIWGWSYGGFMALTAMLRAPGVFRAGFAGSPVANWRLYDTIYTERYMGQWFIPGQGPAEGYKDSSPVNFAGALRGKLLIAFGTGDDNVHMSNSVELQNEFIKAGRYAEFSFYPDRGHGITDAEARIHLFRRMTQFFLDNL
jgi:dipeptidyl-peptidase-4